MRWTARAADRREVGTDPQEPAFRARWIARRTSDSLDSTLTTSDPVFIERTIRHPGRLGHETNPIVKSDTTLTNHRSKYR